MIGFSETPDERGTTPQYTTNDTITVTKDITLYAIYPE